MKILLDTCTIIWQTLTPAQLSEKAQSVLTEPESEIYYSPISCAEVYWATQRGRLSLDRHWRAWFRHFVELNAWLEIPVNLEVIEEAFSLPEPFHADPMDRILVATARMHGLTLLTADNAILSYPHVRTLW
jgi:PIN domain nuclease of toxin-antitoxin system